MNNEFEQDFDFDEEFADELADFEDFSDDDSEVLGLSQVFEPDLTVKHSFD